MKNYEFQIKDIDTQTKLDIYICPDATITEIVECIPIKICNELGLSPEYYTIKIIEAGHYNNSNGYAPELADELEKMYPGNCTFEELYKNRLKNTCFYMKIAKR